MPLPRSASLRLLRHIRKSPGFICPRPRRNEILRRLEVPLTDISISRTTCQWGIPFPQHPEHVMYVWFDALASYLSGIGFPESDQAHFWPADVHLIGKDIVWFHAVLWPCMLMALDLPLPKAVFAHGFVNDHSGVCVWPVSLKGRWWGAGEGLRQALRGGRGVSVWQYRVAVRSGSTAALSSVTPYCCVVLSVQ